MSSHEPTQANTALPATEELAVLKIMTDWMREQQQRAERERTRERFWRNIRVGLIALGMLSGPLYFLWLGGQLRTSPMGEHYAAMVRIDGVIGADKFANAQRIVNSLELAFRDPKSKGVVVLINSPGGSPVQASIVHDRLVALRKLAEGIHNGSVHSSAHAIVLISRLLRGHDKTTALDRSRWDTPPSSRSDRPRRAPAARAVHCRAPTRC